MAAVSILRPVIRTCAVAAIRDQTWAESRVYDSDQTPLAEAILGQAAKPYVVLYTDVDDMPVVPGPNQVYSGEDRLLSLVVEIGVASALRISPLDDFVTRYNGRPLVDALRAFNGSVVPEGIDPQSVVTATLFVDPAFAPVVAIVTGGQPDQIVLKFAATDAGMEWAVDIIEAQVIAALFGNPNSEWGELFRKLINRVKKMPSRRGGQAERGARWAARRTTFMCNLAMYEPSPGIGLEARPLLKRFVDMARAYPQVGVVDCASLVEGFMSGEALPGWKIAQGMLGLAESGAEALVLPGLPAFPAYPPIQDVPLTKIDDVAGEPFPHEPQWPVDPDWVGWEPVPTSIPSDED